MTKLEKGITTTDFQDPGFASLNFVSTNIPGYAGVQMKCSISVVQPGKSHCFRAETRVHIEAVAGTVLINGKVHHADAGSPLNKYSEIRADDVFTIEAVDNPASLFSYQTPK